MKKLVALLGALAGVAALIAQTPPTSGQTAPATNPPATPATVAPAPAAPTAKPTPAPTPAKPKEKDEPPIPGIVIQRPNGNQLGLTIEGGTFKLSFYDKKRKSIPADVTRARANWNPIYKAIPEQTMLNVLTGGKALGGGKPVRPPYAFKLHLTLLKGEGDAEQAVETYTVDCQQSELEKNKK